MQENIWKVCENIFNGVFISYENVLHLIFMNVSLPLKWLPMKSSRFIGIFKMYSWPNSLLNLHTACHYRYSHLSMSYLVMLFALSKTLTRIAQARFFVWALIKHLTVINFIRVCVQLLYSSKFLWSNIFMIFMNYTDIMKIFVTKNFLIAS